MGIRTNMTIYKSGLRVSLLNILLPLVALGYVLHYNGEIFAATGYDTLRYEYFARFGLPDNLVGTSSYRIVGVLETVYRVLPFYWGWLLVIGLLVFLACTTASNPPIQLFMPTALFYYVQTGKDGLTLITTFSLLLCLYAIRTGLLNVFQLFLVVCLCYFTFSIRPSAIFFTLMAVYAWNRSGRLLCVIMLLSIYLYTERDFDFHENTVLISSGGIADLLRVLSFGADIQASLIRFVFNLLSPLLQPMASFTRIVRDPSAYQVLELVGSIHILVFCVVKRSELQLPIVFGAFCLTLIFPFYHGRYMMVLLAGIIFAYVCRDRDTVS